MEMANTMGRRRRVALAALSFALAGLALWLALRSGGTIQLLTEAAGIDKQDKEGVGKLVKVAKAIKTPLLVAAGALVPLVLIGGGAALMIGNRMGMKLLTSGAAGMLVLAAAGAFAA